MSFKKEDNEMAHQQDPTSPAAELHFKKIKRQKIVGEKGSIDMEFIRSRMLVYRDWDRCINRDSKTSNEQR